MERGGPIKGGAAQLQDPTISSPSHTAPHPALFLPKSQEMSSDNEMAVSDVSTAESTFRGAAEAPTGAGARAAGDGATCAALREQIARLEAATGLNAQVEAMARAARKAQLWNILWEHLADDPTLVQAVSELERLDEVSPSFLPSSG